MVFRLALALFFAVTACGPVYEGIRHEGKEAPVFLIGNPWCWWGCVNSFAVTGGDLANEGTTSGTKNISQSSSTSTAK